MVNAGKVEYAEGESGPHVAFIEIARPGTSVSEMLTAEDVRRVAEHLQRLISKEPES